jgi:molybdopterin molybdotransferase
MSGRRRLTRPRLRVLALEAVPNPGSRRGYLRVRLERAGDGFGARLTGEQGSAILRSMVDADGLAIVPPDTVVGLGSYVEVMQLRELPS